jgi:hypothetical protein
MVKENFKGNITFQRYYIPLDPLHLSGPNSTVCFLPSLFFTYTVFFVSKNFSFVFYFLPIGRHKSQISLQKLFPTLHTFGVKFRRTYLFNIVIKSVRNSWIFLNLDQLENRYHFKPVLTSYPCPFKSTTVDQEEHVNYIFSRDKLYDSMVCGKNIKFQSRFVTLHVVWLGPHVTYHVMWRHVVWSIMLCDGHPLWHYA